MPLPLPREGEEHDFHAYPNALQEGTIGNIEHAVWASINHLCSREVAQGVLNDVYRVRGKRALDTGATSLKLYIRQAFEFYSVAASARTNTAPLFYYYSFLNLAKAVCELNVPAFHRKRESFGHGLSWRPNPRWHSNPYSDYVRVVRRGVWHVLWESVFKHPFAAQQETRIHISPLLSYCPEVSVEYERTFHKSPRRIDLQKPGLVLGPGFSTAWLRFSVHRGELRYWNLSGPQFIAMVTDWGLPIREVKSEKKELRCFEQLNPRRPRGRSPYADAVQSDVRNLTVISHPTPERTISYCLPFVNLPIRMPHLLAMYTLMFWLGSLVRYDPHSLAALQDSKYWILIDGLMSQTRLWLLELFEWEIFQTETVLGGVK